MSFPFTDPWAAMRHLSLLLASTLLCGCVHAQAPAGAPTGRQIYQMAPQEVHAYLAHMQQSQPDLRQRIAAIGRRNIGQPYKLNLLGEYPFELHDTLPMFSLDKSDCVVFAEHTYAMALSSSWEEFFWMLQRIRYKDGIIGVASRNHYTEVDWNVNNSWLVTDITAALAGPGGPAYDMTVDRSGFLSTVHRTPSSIPVQATRQSYLTPAQLMQVLPQLQDGDMLNVVSVRDGVFGVSHVGLVVTGSDGRRNFLNSAEPQVREESFEDFLARSAEREARNVRERRNGLRLAGFKVLRLNDAIVVPPALPQPRPGAAALNRAPPSTQSGSSPST